MPVVTINKSVAGIEVEPGDYEVLMSQDRSSIVLVRVRDGAAPAQIAQPQQNAAPAQQQWAPPAGNGGGYRGGGRQPYSGGGGRRPYNGPRQGGGGRGQQHDTTAANHLSVPDRFALCAQNFDRLNDFEKEFCKPDGNVARSIANNGRISEAQLNVLNGAASKLVLAGLQLRPVEQAPPVQRQAGGNFPPPHVDM